MSIIDIAKGFARTSKSKGFGEEMVGGWSSPSTVRYGTAGSDSSGGKVSVVLDGSDEPVTLACETPVKSGQRVSVVYQSGTYKVVALKQMTEDIDSVKESQAEQEEAISQISGQVEQARQQAQAAQQAAEEAGGRADDALEAAQQAAGDAQAGVAEAKQAAEEASGRAEELAGQVSEVRTEVEGLSTAVSGAVDTAEGALSKATEVGQSLESYKVEASQTYLDKQTGETLATKAELEATAQEITLSVSQEYATKAELDGISVGGRNLARETSGEWSEWWSPNYGVNNSTTYQAKALFPDTTQAGDDVTCQVEMEFDGIEADEAGGFTIYSQGPVDGAWDVTNVWTRLFDLKEPPADGVYKYVKTLPYPGSSVGRLEHYLGIRCNYVSAGRMRWRCIKVEMGNKPTDWTPAPEDAEERYATKAELTVAEDSITAQVSEVATTADAAMSKATEVEQTAEGLSAEVSQVSQTADGAVAQLATLAATVEGISSEVSVAQETADSAVEAASQAQQDITGFKNTVSQTYQTKADADSAMAQEVLDRNSAIEQSAAQITQTVSETYATIEQVDGISVGGRNLAIGTNQGVSNWSNWSFGTSGASATKEEVDVNGVRAVKFTRNDVANTSWTYLSYAKFASNLIEPSTDYVISFDVLSSVNSGFNVGLLSNDSSLIWADLKSTGQVDANVWTKLSARITTREALGDPTSTGIRIYFTAWKNDPGISYTFKNLKLEKGTVATDWTPAPEDMATTAQVSSAIEQSAEEIALSVQQSYQPKGDYLTGSEAASTYASKSELSVAEEAITSQVSEVAETASGAYSLASSVQQTAEGLEVEITAAQESAEEAAKTATSFLRVTQSGVQLARESGGNDPQINLNVSGAASYVDVAGIPSGAGGYRHARIDGSSLALGTSGGAHSIEIDAESQTITAQSLQVDADIITLHSPAATLQASEHYGGLMVQAGGLTGLLADWVTSHGGTANDWEWRKWASGKWEAWAIYGNLSCKPNGTTDVTCKIPSAIGNTANNYVVLCTFTRQGNTSAADGWSKLAWVVLNQAASGFTVRIWGDNTFASPYIPMSLSVLVLGRP